ncbi:UNVERIFIED_CONTAM: Enzymatic polyprotein [Sesamum indicum]
MSLLKDKLKDWCYQPSIQKNIKRLRGKIKRTPLCCDNNDLPTIIGESGEPRKRRKQSSDSYPRNSRRTFSRRRSWWSKSKARTYKSGRRTGPKGFHPKDLHEQRQDPPKEPPQEELSDEPIPEPLKVSKTKIVGPVEQKDIYPPTSCRNVVNYKNLKPQMTSWMQSTMATSMTVSNKTMRQDFNLSRYDGFRIRGIGKVLNQIGLNQRKHHIIYKVSSGEFAISMELTGKLMFDIHPRIAYNLADQDFSRVLTLHQDFKRKGLMKEGNRPYSITYRFAYALSNTHHSDLFLRKEYIEISRIFKEFAKVMTPDPIRIPRIGGVDIIIKDHPVLDRTLSSRTEFSSRMSFPKDRIIGYKGKEKELLKVLTPQEIRQPVVGKYEGMLEIAGHEILVVGVAGRENEIITLGLSFLEDHKPWGRKGNGMEFSLDGVTIRDHIVEKIRNFPDVLKGKKQLQSFLGLVNFAGIFIKDLARYRKDFRPLLKEMESSKWKWEEIHNKRVHELKQVCSNLPKLAILQDEDELVVYTDANDYRWATMLMKKTTTGKNPVDILEGCSQNNRSKFDT